MTAIAARLPMCSRHWGHRLGACTLCKPRPLPEAIATVRASALRVGKPRPLAKVAPASRPTRVARAAPAKTGRPSKPITYRGITHTQAEWAKQLGVSPGLVRERVKHGVPLDMAPHRGQSCGGWGEWNYELDMNGVGL